MVPIPELRWAGSALALFAVGAVLQLTNAPAPLSWALYLACYLVGGWRPALDGLCELRAGTLDVDLLMIVAALVAAAIGQIFDGALLIVIFATSGALEDLVTRRTADSVRRLLDLAPERASRLAEDGAEQRVDTAELRVGDAVLVRPGERIGADGEVTDGTSEIDQAGITGEPLPVVRRAGDPVFAGTLNGTGALRIRVTRAAADSVVARIVALVEAASATKARGQLFVERVEQRYSVGVVLATVALFAIPLASGAALAPTLLRAMTFMIVASPCAVVLATMPALLAAIANAGRHGLLVKSAVALETFRTITLVAFDKTGTLTEGTPTVTDIVPLAGMARDELLALAAAAEHASAHPLARAIVTAARERRLTVPAATEFSSAPGRGVRARVGGRLVEVGSPASLGTASLGTASLGTASLGGARLGTGGAQAADQLERAGKTAVAVLVDGDPVGLLALADRVRPDAAATVAALRTLTGHTPVLLSGDNPGAADRLAAQVGITEVHAGLLPEDKVARVRALRAEGHRVLLVGDGVNDAPAMAAADLGVALGQHGSDLAMDTADAVIVRDELATLPAVVELSARAHRLVRANLVLAAAVIVALVTWDICAVLPLPLGVAGHEGSTVLVGLNGLRLLRRAAWPAVGGTRRRRRRPARQPGPVE
ncbi:MAG TPA: heavy metal translocating P-type ATPase [Pseudonocardia sp.]|nr:heavy metal translocating P-type ATPase [Pseudonocardia sp.]